MALPWFYHPDLEAAGSTVSLPDEEAQHARGAKRLRSGDAICLFDGRGVVADARIETVDAKAREVVATVLDVRRVPPLGPATTLATAVPKADRLSTLLSMTAQLGVQRFVPMQCARSVVGGRQRFGRRGARIVIEACKQAQCAHAMTIENPASVADVLAEARQRNETILAADPSGGSFSDVLVATRSNALTVLIGPEGGFTPDELDACRTAGAQFVSLGPTILRIETACVAAAAIIGAHPHGA